MIITNKKWIGLLLFVILLSCSKNSGGDPNGGNNGGEDDPNDDLIGAVLPDWEEGYLDIHAINTGRGESQLFIFPDGTTMLVDAAGANVSPGNAIPPTASKPNDNVSAGLVVTNYTRHFIKPASNKINYLHLTHFDPDHMGAYSTSFPLDPTQQFRMTGITEVGAKIDFDKLIDRGYPDYNYPTNLISGATGQRITNYIKFVDWAKANKGVVAEQFAVGRNDQIVMTENPAKYPDFEIRNICSNGVVWTGSGTNTTNTFPPDPSAGSENVFTTAFTLSYGKFDFFSGGDLQYNGRTANPWMDIEAPVAAVVSEVEVMKANHHATLHCNGTAILNKLKPQAVIIHVFRDVQPNPETIGRMLDINPYCQIFTTNMTDANKPRLGADLNKLRATQGHIVVRVSPGGDEYYIYTLDDTNQDYKVNGVYGPYKSK